MPNLPPIPESLTTPGEIGNYLWLQCHSGFPDACETAHRLLYDHGGGPVADMVRAIINAVGA